MLENGMLVLPLEEVKKLETKLKESIKKITELESELKAWRELRPELCYVEREWPDGTPFGQLELREGYHD